MLTGLHLTVLVALMAAGIAVDWLLGEMRRWHPLVGFGHCANVIENKLNSGALRRAKGVLAWTVAVLPPVMLAAWVIETLMAVSVLAAAAVHVALLYFSLGLRSLRDHMLPIAQALTRGDLELARNLTSRIVTRDTRRAKEPDLAKAAVESLLENGNDAVFGTLFWFIVAGGPGALLFRLANTLDAMWGYRNTRFHAFGWAAARIDDGLNWVPARLTALSYTLLGDARCAWQCWKTQAAAWTSPNAGPVMSAGAGALRLTMGGSAEYDGVRELRPTLGMGPAAKAVDIGRAWRLVVKACVLWVAVLAACAFFMERILHA